MQHVVAGRVQAMIETPTLMAPLVQAGKVRALAVTSAERSAGFAALPTLREPGVADYEVTAWQAMLMRREVPPAIQGVLQQAAGVVLPDPMTRERMGRIGVEICPDVSPAATVAQMRAEVARWMPLAGRLRAG